ncbi:MAG TPA: sigma-70 factor domain-containing protein, partial [Propionibacteriaceae bacterium]|nr:sigma-70 factor domain-containing protein [Propionibacteriaceae bacterium]
MSTARRTRTTEGIDGKDAVGLYLVGIARTALLTAEEEVELALRIEAGLYAQAILEGEITEDDRGGRPVVATRDELEELAHIGEQAMNRF